MSEYLQPDSLNDALKALANGKFSPVAGATDFYPARAGGIVDDDVLDISRIVSLRGIEEQESAWRIGATTTWSEIADTPLPAIFDGLKRAAREVGGRQIQNTGTIAGNICNASPAADGVPPLLTLNADVELTSIEKSRSVPLGDFITGNRETVRGTNELVTAIIVPKPAGDCTSTFLKLGARRYLVISIAMVAAVLEADGDNRIASARIAVGACSAVGQRLPELEAALAGREIEPGLAEVPTERHLSPLSPIDDVRATGNYRNDAALTLVRRALAELGAGR